jgi:hypothetical protein
MTLQVVEVLERSVQGRTQPYICRCADDEVYFVKGRSATRKGLIHEWLCAHLARALGLPVAGFEIASVTDELIQADFTGKLKDLGAGPCFASRKVLGQELAAAQVPHIAEALRRDVLVFDWWVRNADRCLTAKGGNVNLLWQPFALERDDDDAKLARGQMTVIDHNLAFDEAFSPADFCQTHVFSADLAATFSDFDLRQSYSDRLSQALAELENAWNNVPLAWHFVDSEQTIPASYPKDQVWELLGRIASDDFWNLPA